MLADDDEATFVAANAFSAACMLCGELNELRLPNCDNELSALSVAAVAALFPILVFELLVLRLLQIQTRNIQIRKSLLKHTSQNIL